MFLRHFLAAGALLCGAASLRAEPPKEPAAVPEDRVDVSEMGAASRKCMEISGVRCARLGRDNPAWKQVLQGLSPAEQRKMIGAFGVNPAVLNEDRPGGSETVAPGGTSPDRGRNKTGPRSRPRPSGSGSAGTSSSTGDDTGSDSASDPGTGTAADAGSGGEAEAAAGAPGAEMAGKRALSDSQAQAMSQKLKGLGSEAGALFGPEKQLEDLGGARPDRSGVPGQAGRKPGASGSASSGQSGAATTSTRNFSKYPAVPLPGAPSAASPQPRPAPVLAAAVPARSYGPTQSAGFSKNLTDLRSAGQPVARSGSAAAGTESELTEEEKRDLDQFLNLIDQAATTGNLDSKSANSMLIAAEERLKAGAPLEDPLGAVRAILEQAKGGQRGLTEREQAVVLAAARQLGFRFNRTQAFRLFYALERGEPPPPKVRRLSWWQRLMDTLRGWLSRRW